MPHTLTTLTALALRVETLSRELNAIADAIDTATDALASDASLPIEAYHVAFTTEAGHVL
ncbi:MAG: hypothetical protein ACYDBH_23105 [Acidobacteriaceae bacterium]